MHYLHVSFHTVPARYWPNLNTAWRYPVELLPQSMLLILWDIKMTDREAFEAHITCGVTDLKRVSLMVKRQTFDKERYIDPESEYLWSIWQAACKYKDEQDDERDNVIATLTEEIENIKVRERRNSERY